MSFTLQIGAAAPDFKLPGVDGKDYSLDSFKKAKLLVVVFTCNHCPSVVGSHERLNRFYDKYRPLGVEVVGINANETTHHPTDSFEHMKASVAEVGIKYPYLRDESQKVALAYGALRTPHYYIFDVDRKLRYTGRMDDSPKNASKATTHELTDAIDALLAGKPVAVPMTNPLGCNVKWKNHDEHWMPPDACDLVP